MNNNKTNTGETLSEAFKVSEHDLIDHVAPLIRQTIEETLNKLLDDEANAICNAKRYQRSADRLDTRAGKYTRKLLTTVGELEVNVPWLRKLPFE